MSRPLPNGMSLSSAAAETLRAVLDHQQQQQQQVCAVVCHVPLRVPRKQHPGLLDTRCCPIVTAVGLFCVPAGSQQSLTSFCMLSTLTTVCECGVLTSQSNLTESGTTN